MGLDEGRWRITQISTGRLVAKSAINAEQACRCLEGLLPVADWTLDLDGIVKAIPDFKDAARKVIASHDMRTGKDPQ